MSGTLAASKINIRRLMRDLPVGSSSPKIPDETLVATINSWLLQVTSTLSFADTWSSGAIALVAGTRVYQLSGTDYQTLAMLRRHTDGVVLEPVGEKQLQQYYQNNPNASGSPNRFALYETSDEKLNVDLYPTPDVAAVSANASLDAFLSTTVTPLSLGTDVIGLSPLGVNALELLVAGECLAETNPPLSAVMTKRGEDMLTTEKERRTQFRRQDTVVRGRF